MQLQPIRNTLICSYRLMDRIGKGAVPFLYEGNAIKVPQHIVPDAACPDWYAYSFDENGTMTTILISDWYPEKPSLWRRMLRTVFKRL